MAANLIIQFLDGNGDHLIIKGTNNLKVKASVGKDCPQVDVPIGLREKPQTTLAALVAALKDAHDLTRIYLRGHGNYEVKTLGGWPPDAVAKLLKHNGLKNAKVLSITGCNAARGDYPNNKPERLTAMENFHERKALSIVQLGATLSSFAGLFHRALGEAPGAIKTIPVTARMYSVNVEESGKKTLNVGEVGREVKAGTKSASYSKVIYKWNGDGQQADWIKPGHTEYIH